ncbi:MAG: hypothetical protein SFU87_19115 [Chitinophagaceae bacterium]|nr:hypothetical protein [Chitinophagaceae bacterium]
MNLEYKNLIPESFNNSSRVWVYQSNRPFTLSEALQVEDLLHDFATNWKSHGEPVKGYANLFFSQFIVLMADETATGVSGCSTDSSVRLMKEIEKRFNVQLFDRQLLAFVLKDKIELLPFSQLGYAVENGVINTGTLYFNNLVQTKEELLNKWMIPVKESWLAKRISLKTQYENLN